jgi:hypothetical protein
MTSVLLLSASSSVRRNATAPVIDIRTVMPVATHELRRAGMVP